MTQNGSKVGFFEVTEKFGYYFFLDLLYNESLYQGRIQDFRKVSQNFLINFQHSHI